MSVLARYALFQIPATVVVGAALWLFWDRTGLPGWMGALVLAGWVAKDALLYPLLRRAYEPTDANAAKLLVGARGVARSRLAPDGQVLVQGELWRARAVTGEEPIEPDTDVVVRDADRFTLLVARAR
jgi:membrane protein implicated in regulation of membrane protease activity